MPYDAIDSHAQRGRAVQAYALYVQGTNADDTHEWQRIDGSVYCDPVHVQMWWALNRARWPDDVRVRIDRVEVPLH